MATSRLLVMLQKQRIEEVLPMERMIILLVLPNRTASSSSDVMQSTAKCTRAGDICSDARAPFNTSAGTYLCELQTKGQAIVSNSFSTSCSSALSSSSPKKPFTNTMLLLSFAISLHTPPLGSFGII